MSTLERIARVAYRGCRRLICGPAPVDPNPFPVDVWTDPSYRAWFEAHRVSAQEVAQQRTSQQDFAYRPTFSFIVPLYKTPLDYLEVMADSVLAQTYPELELVLINASPDDRGLARAVEEYASRDPRVKHVILEGNLGITENSNKGIAASTGDFCCFLDHDDFIEPDLLFEYVKALNEHEDIDVLFCDEDLVKYDERTDVFEHLHVLFKPAYSPELMLCKNAVVHLMTVRRSIIDKMPTPDCHLDGAQDYNMIMYCASQARRVHGVQKVLYHWRISDASTAANPDAKPYSQKSYRLSASYEMTRRQIDGAIVASGIVNVHNLWLRAPQGATTSVIVDIDSWLGEPPASGACAYNTIDRFCEFFCQNNSLRDVEIIFVGSVAEWRTDLMPGYSYVACPGLSSQAARLNAAAKTATGAYLTFIDGGCIFDSAEPLEQLMGMCSLDGVGVAAPKLLYADGRVKSYGVAVTPECVLPLHRGHDDDFPGYQCNLRSFQNASACGLQGLTITRELFCDLGGFDENLDGELAAVDLCLRVRQRDLRVAVMCTVKLRSGEKAPEHYFDCAENMPDYEVGVEAFNAKWSQVRTQGDPYYNVNLDQASPYYQVGDVETA